MNLRILKKLSKRAEPLIREIGQHIDIGPADRDETLYAMDGMPRHQVKHSSFIAPLQGTPLVWERTSYEYDEWDATAAWQWLENHVQACTYDWGAEFEDRPRRPSPRLTNPSRVLRVARKLLVESDV